MKITRSSTDGATVTTKGPAEWFTGDVYIDSVAVSAAPSRVQAALVHFMPGARTAWHRHPLGQTLFVTEGIGLCQHRGGPVETIRPGDRVYIEPDEALARRHPQPADGPPRAQRGRRRARRRPLGPARQRQRVQQRSHARH